MTDHFPWRTRNRAKLRRLETWDSKRRDKAWQERHEIARAKDRAEELERTRKSPSLARGRVRHQGFWNRWWPERREDLAHLIALIMRQICGEASGGSRWSSV